MVSRMVECPPHTDSTSSLCISFALPSSSLRGCFSTHHTSMTSPLGVGDILAIASMLSDIYVALNDARGSAADYETTVKETEQFLADLKNVQRIALSLARDLGHKLADPIINKIDMYKAAMEKFMRSIQKYKKVFGEHF